MCNVCWLIGNADTPLLFAIQDNRELLEKKIETAKRRKRGVYSGNFETPAEYKRRMKNNKQNKKRDNKMPEVAAAPAY